VSPAFEKRLLQAAIILALPLSVVVAIGSVVAGAAFLYRGVLQPSDLDSHYRYLSGIFLALLAGFASCIPDVERKGARMRLLGALVIAGGLARGWGMIDLGMPSRGHVIGLVLELVVTPALLLWQARVARRFA
jgi:hypothetical protein